jgi:hypothetical protein
MKKLFTFLAFMILSLSFVYTQSYVNQYQMNEDFSTIVAPWGFTLGSNTTITIPDLSAPRGNVFQLAVASASGRRISNKVFSPAFTVVESSADKKLYVEFDWQSGTPTGGNRGFIRLLEGTNIILALGAEDSKNTNVLHFGNLDAANQNALVTSTLITPEGGNFPRNEWYRVKIKLNFQTHIVEELIITRLSNSFAWTISNTAFINNTPSTISKIEIEGGRQGSYNGAWTTQIDDFKVYTVKEAAALTSVTINYKDSEGTLLKTSRVQQNLEVGTTYYATADDKATFSDENFYYAYNAAASTDNVVVAEGAVINLIFKKTAKTSGTYIWSGSTNSNWNNADENFGVGASPLMGYQDNNPILFPAVPATKTVNLNANLTIGANDITLYGDGYNFSGTGSISGTGKFILGMQPGETTTMGIRNNMAKVEINGGEAILTNDMGTATYDLADGAKITLQTGAAFSKAIAATGTATIQTNSNVFYSPTITGASTVNLILGVSGNLASVDWSSKVLTVMPTNAQVNVTTNLGSAGYGVASNSVQNSKLNLGENVRMLFNYNPAEGGGTIVYIGELKGEVGSSVEGGWVNSATRGLNYYIGGLGTDATYNGVFKNYSTAPSAPLNIFKKGSGVLTLTAANPDWILGSLKVDEGTVVLNGSIPEAGVPVTVATGAILKGTGTIDGATTVNGTLEGSLNFGSSLTLNGITKFVVNGVNEGEFDKINVTGVANVGGTIDVTVNNPSGVKGVNKVRNANPPVGTTIKLINAGSIVTSLPTVHYSSNGWTFKPATGELIYDPDNIVSGINSNVVPFSIYPTLTRDVINVEGNVKTIDVFSLTGQKVNSLVANGTKTVVNMSNLSAGAYIIRANMEDGSANMQNVILQK